MAIGILRFEQMKHNCRMRPPTSKNGLWALTFSKEGLKEMKVAPDSPGMGGALPSVMFTKLTPAPR